MGKGPRGRKPEGFVVVFVVAAVVLVFVFFFSNSFVTLAYGVKQWFTTLGAQLKSSGVF